MLKRVVAVLCLLLCLSVTAYADVADPGGGPYNRMRGPELEPEFEVTRVIYLNRPTFEDKVRVDYTYTAPKLSELTYSVYDDKNELISEEKVTVETGRGEFTIFFPNPTGDEEMCYQVRVKCLTEYLSTRFGEKKLDKPRSVGEERFQYRLVKEGNKWAAEGY